MLPLFLLGVDFEGSAHFHKVIGDTLQRLIVQTQGIAKVFEAVILRLRPNSVLVRINFDYFRIKGLFAFNLALLKFIATNSDEIKQRLQCFVPRQLSMARHQV